MRKIVFVMCVVWGCMEGIALGATPKRVVSLAPSVTEIIYALDVQEALVAVSQYCNYPKVVQEKPQVGSMVDVNIEEIVRLQPDLIIYIPSSTPQKNHIERLGYDTLRVSYQRISDIYETIHAIGAVLGVSDASDKLIFKLQEQVEMIHKISSLVRGQTTNAGRTLLWGAFWVVSSLEYLVRTTGSSDTLPDEHAFFKD